MGWTDGWVDGWIWCWLTPMLGSSVLAQRVVRASTEGHPCWRRGPSVLAQSSTHAVQHARCKTERRRTHLPHQRP
eukprot:351201-Chlamydomonas_euryale.AAC.9